MTINELSEKIEKISKIYATNHNINRDESWYILKLQEELGELIQAYLMMTNQARKKGKTKEQLREEFEKETADVLCHAILLMKNQNIDIEKVVSEKWLVWLDKS